MAETLVELLAQHRIKVRSYQPGHQEHVVCPACEGGNTREKSLSVLIDQDGEGATWKCHRGTCASSPGGARLYREQSPRKSERVIKSPPPHVITNADKPDWLYAWFADRCIRAGIVDEYGVYARRHFFTKDLSNAEAIVFPVMISGKVVNRKYRGREFKHPQSQEKDGVHALFGFDQCGPDPRELIWVEGEPDVMAIAECGRRAVTFKDGAPDERSVNHGRRFEALETHEKALKNVKSFILAGDNDVPGRILREELARRLGRHRCWLVSWPEGCKDANETLIKLGPDAVLKALDEAEPYPIDGIQAVKRGTLRRFRDLPAPTVMSTGMLPVDAVLKLPTEGRLIIVTGYPGSGKSSWVRAVMVHTAGTYARKWGVFTPEMQPWEQFVAECAEVRSGRVFWPVANYTQMSDDDLDEAEDWLSDKVTMIVCDTEKQAPTLDWLIERGEALVIRNGMTDFWIDPWNQVDHKRPPGMSETEFIGEALQRLATFGLRFGCNVWVNVHPAKPQPTRDGKKGGPPGPYDCAGSAHWYNRADIGITVHAPALGFAELHRWKARFMRRWGGVDKSAALNFDHVLGKYSAPIDAAEKGTGGAPSIPPGDDLLNGEWGVSRG